MPNHFERDPILAWGEVTYAAGVPTLTASNGIKSITDGGIGILTVTLQRALATLLSVSMTPKLTSSASPRVSIPSVAYSAPDLALKFYGSVQGGLLTAPTNASTQATGTGATDWNVNLSHVLCDGNSQGEVAAAADFSIHDTTHVHESFDDGDSIVAAILVANIAGVYSFEKVLGVPAVTGAEVAPTDAEIATAMTAAEALSYAVLGYSTLNRTGDETVTQTNVNTGRLGILADPADGVYALEVRFRNTGA